MSQPDFTPGELIRAVGSWGLRYKPLSELGIPTPPRKKGATEKEMLNYAQKTGRGGIYLENELYQNWAGAYNQWIKEHPDLAADYGLDFQDETWLPVK